MATGVGARRAVARAPLALLSVVVVAATLVMTSVIAARGDTLQAAATDDSASRLHRAGAGAKPIVIAHRGASGSRPEHTLAAYRLALLQGADFIETDLVVTGDGVLVARHDNALAQVRLDASEAIARDAAGAPLLASYTTDVADHPEFEDRLTLKRVDGRLLAGWFVEDFTLAELKTLRARERMPGLRRGSRLYDDQFTVPTLGEIIRLVEKFDARGFEAGLYIEIKHPTYFLHDGRYLDGKTINVDLTVLLLDRLQQEGFIDPARLYLQSFEVYSLLRLHDAMLARGLDIPLVQLLGDVFNQFRITRPYDIAYHARVGADLDTLYGSLRDHLQLSVDITFADLAAPDVLRYLSRSYAAGIGPPKHNLMPVVLEDPADVDGDGVAGQRARLTGMPGSLLADAKAAGLLVHPYTLRAEEPFLVRDADRVLPVAREARRLLEMGVDGFFIDQPAEGRAAVESYLQPLQRPSSSGNGPGQHKAQ